MQRITKEEKILIKLARGYWYNSIREIKEANKKNGGYWFNRNKTFPLKTLPKVYYGRYFISISPAYISAENGLPALDRYRPAIIDETGNIHFFGSNNHNSKEAAEEYIDWYEEKHALEGN